MGRLSLRDVVVVLVAGFCKGAMQFLLAMGSVFLVQNMEAFDVNISTAAWPVSIHNACQNLCGIIMGALVIRLGLRQVTIISGFLVFLGVFLTVFANSIVVSCFTFGAIAGIGTSGMCVCSMIIIQQHFDKDRAFALGLANWLSSISFMVGAPAYQLLSNRFGWRGAMAIISVVMLNTVACGLLVRSPPNDSEERPQTEKDNTEISEIVENKTTMEYLPLEKDNEGYTDSELGDKDMTHLTPDTDSMEYSETELNSEIQQLTVKNDDNNSPSQKTYGSVPAAHEHSETEQRNWYKELVDYCKILMNPLFMLFVISRTFSTEAVIGLNQETPSRAVTHGTYVTQASLLVSARTFGSFTCRLLSSALVKFECVDRKLLYVISCFMVAIGITVSTLFTEFTACFIMAIITGAGIGFNRTLVFIVMIDLFGPEKAPSTEGWSLTFTGILDIVMLPFAGWLVVVTLNNNATFYLFAAIMYISGTSALLIYVLVKCGKASSVY